MEGDVAARAVLTSAIPDWAAAPEEGSTLRRSSIGDRRVDVSSSPERPEDEAMWCEWRRTDMRRLNRSATVDNRFATDVTA
ncbi:hypothetical protein GCM10023223_19110 [Stackebrandtia albiflava]